MAPRRSPLSRDAWVSIRFQHSPMTEKGRTGTISDRAEIGQKLTVDRTAESGQPRRATCSRAGRPRGFRSCAQLVRSSRRAGEVVCSTTTSRRSRRALESQCARLEARPYCQRQISALGGLLLGHVITFAICRTYSYDFCRPSYAQIRKRPIGIRRLMT
jgi:hypothetical protein